MREKQNHWQPSGCVMASSNVAGVLINTWCFYFFLYPISRWKITSSKVGEKATKGMQMCAVYQYVSLLGFLCLQL